MKSVGRSLGWVKLLNTNCRLFFSAFHGTLKRACFCTFITFLVCSVGMDGVSTCTPPPNINLYVQRKSPTVHILTQSMDAACTSEMPVTLPTSTWCNYPRTNWHQQLTTMKAQSGTCFSSAPCVRWLKAASVKSAELLHWVSLWNISKM
jgi:hypothetical protein